MTDKNKNIEERAKTGLENDFARYANKLMLDSASKDNLDKIKRMTLPKNLTGEERDRQIQDGAEVVTIMNMINEYANMDLTGENYSKVSEEVKLYINIHERLKRLDKKLTRDKDQGLSTGANYDALRRMTRDMLIYFEKQRDGNLELEPDGRNIRAVGLKLDNYDIENSHIENNEIEDYDDYIKEDVPLFPHEPSVNDIVQGQLGDCYLVSGLSEIALRNPEKIKESIRDNRDGTVTVRFWERTSVQNHMSRWSARKLSLRVSEAI